MRAMEFRCWYDNRMHKVTQIDFAYERIHLFAADIISFKEGVLMPYIGLKDKNGVKIYENDIIHIDLDGLDDFDYIIGWSEDHLRYYLYSIREKDLNKIGGILEAHLKSLIDKIEVIGNKYQNPELWRTENE